MLIEDISLNWIELFFILDSSPLSIYLSDEEFISLAKFIQHCYIS